MYCMSIEFITKVAFTSNTSQHSVMWPSHHSHTQPQTSNHPNDASQPHPPITPTTNHANHPFLSNHLRPPTTTSTTSDVATAQTTRSWAYSMFFLIILFYFTNTLNLTASRKPPAGMQPPWPITWPMRPLQPTMTHNTTYATPATHHNPHHNPHNPHSPQPPPMRSLQPTKPHMQHTMPEMGPDVVGHVI